MVLIARIGSETMKKMSLWIKLFLLLGIVAAFLVSCFGIPAIPDTDMFSAKGYFEDGKMPETATEEVLGWKVRRVETGNRDGPLVLFVHGSPGSWENFARFLDDDELAAKAHLVAIDRPGYGGSGRGKPERSLEVQAGVFRPVLERARAEGRRTILVGHSYGGPVIARAAVDFPELIDALILVSPSIDPDLEDLPWYQYVGNWFFVRWAVPAMLDVSNQEVLALERELRDMESSWKDIRMPVTVIQGGSDTLVHPGNADFAERVFVNAPLELVLPADANHFIPWTHPRLMRDAILGYLEP